MKYFYSHFHILTSDAGGWGGGGRGRGVKGLNARSPFFEQGQYKRRELAIMGLIYLLPRPRSF